MTKEHKPENISAEAEEKPDMKETAKPAELEHLSYEEMEAKLNEVEAKANQYWDQLLRTKAELENIRRRSERDVANAHKYGLEKLVGEIILVVDGMEHGLVRITDEQQKQNPLVKAMHEGMEMSMKMLLKALEKFGVTQVDPLGQPFNPELHQAVSTKEDPKAKTNTVLQVLQKGYLLQGRLLRPAMVVVAKG